MWRLLCSASTIGLVSLIGGAAASHVWRDRLSPEAIMALQTGFQYALIHALGAALLAVMAITVPAKFPLRFMLTGWLWTAGSLLFAGGIALNRLWEISAAGMLAPIGGTVLMAGWATLAASVIRGRNNPA